MGDLTTAPLPPDKNGRPSSITMAVALPTPTELTRWELADFLAFAQVGPLPLGQLEGQDANRSIRVADHNASARDLPRPPHDFADSALARNDVFRIENAGPREPMSVDRRQLSYQTRHVEFRHRDPRVHGPQGFQQ
jgi:hypothetical protein